MSNRPKVSVIMAVRNGENTVAQTIESILSQTFRNFEFIIVNDASEDSTECILDKYAKKDKRIKIITNKERQERAVSRNTAVKASSGEYIAVTDSDDYSFPNRLDVEVTYLDKNPEIYLVGSRAYVIDEKGLKIGKSVGRSEPFEVTNILEKGNLLVHSSVMFRNTKEFEYRKKFKYAQDYDLFLQMVGKGKRLVLLPNILVKYGSKADLIYDDYLVKQYQYSAKAKQLLMQAREGIQDGYDKFEVEDLDRDTPQKLKDELEFLKLYSHKEFKSAREQMTKILKEYGYSPKRILYFVDTFLGGKIFFLGKNIKRILFRLVNA